MAISMCDRELGRKQKGEKKKWSGGIIHTGIIKNYKDIFIISQKYKDEKRDTYKLK